MPLDLIFGFLTATVIPLVVYHTVLLKRKEELDQPAWFSLLVLISCSLGLIVSDMFASPSFPLSLPLNWPWLMLIIGLLSYTNYYINKSTLWLGNAVIITSMMAISHPWWVQGAAGWIRLALLSIGMTLFIEARYHALTPTQQPKTQSFLSLLPIGLITPMLLGFANTSHLFSMLLVILPLTILSLWSWVFQPISTLGRQWDWLPISTLILFANAATRFVPSPEMGDIERHLMDGAVALFLIAPSLALINPKLKSNIIGKVIYITFLVLGLGLCLGVYLYEPTTSESGPNWDYGTNHLTLPTTSHKDFS